MLWNIISLRLSTSYLIVTLFLPAFVFFFIYVDSTVYIKNLISFLAVHSGSNNELNSTCQKAHLLVKITFLCSYRGKCSFNIMQD